MEDNSNAEVFVYMGGDVDVPSDVVRVRVHPSVTVIPESAFFNRRQLEEVELCEGLLEIGQSTFDLCKSLKSIKIPPTVAIISRTAFYGCVKLEEIELNEGLLEIGPHAFRGCSSLKTIIIPSTVRTIGEYAFHATTKVSSINLPDSIESIGENAFRGTNLLNFRMPPSITTVPIGLFKGCASLLSVELVEDTTQIGNSAFNWCRLLRNVALPINTEIGERSVFNYCDDLNKIFDTVGQIVNALKHRFDELPIHKMIYYQSYNNLTVKWLSDVVHIESGQSESQLNPTGKEQDCLGMTPLHILACSTVQNIELYRILIDNYPENLITKDRWGAVPLFYAAWANAPNEIMQYLAESYQSLHPNYQINFTDMMKTLGKANATVEVIQNLFDLQQESFPEQGIDWEAVLEQLTGLSNVYKATYRILVKCSVTKRMNAIGLKQLRDNIATEIELFWLITRYSNFDRSTFKSMIESKLAEYEATYSVLKEATATLELALWKSKMNDGSQGVERCNKKIRLEQSDLRKQYRISCGADVVIHHVLPYLLPGVTPVI